MSQRISRTQLVTLYKIEAQFFDELAEVGLLKIEEEQQECYVQYDYLGDLERFTNLHYDLGVNVAGLEVIQNLLKKMEDLRAELERLKHSPLNELNFQDWNEEND